MDLTINEIYEYFENIGCCVFATIDNGYPETRIAHLRAFDDDGIYFMTMDCKPFYKQLKDTGKLSICGLNANSNVEKNGNEYVFEPGYSARLTGDVKEISMKDIKAKNNPMFDLCIADQKKYPSMVVFVVHSFTGEIFDYDFEMANRDHKLKRIKFSYGQKELDSSCFKINDNCTKCGSCKRTCSFKAIDKIDGKYVIDPTKCDECGSCQRGCPMRAISGKIS